jgi:hypothetical protein
VEQQKPRAVMTIIWNADGSVTVNGPIKDKIVCYGLLDCARDAIRDFNHKGEQQIEVPKLAVVPPYAS